MGVSSDASSLLEGVVKTGHLRSNCNDPPVLLTLHIHQRFRLIVNRFHHRLTTAKWSLVKIPPLVSGDASFIFRADFSTAFVALKRRQTSNQSIQMMKPQKKILFKASPHNSKRPPYSKPPNTGSTEKAMGVPVGVLTERIARVDLILCQQT